MADTYYIVEWGKRYEVNAHGGQAGQGDTLKARPLDFVRLAAHGRSLSAGSRALERIAGTSQRYLNAYGVFCKLLEIAADNPRDRRGWILDHRERTADALGIAAMAQFPSSAVERALADLVEAGWIGRADYASGEKCPTPDNSRKLPEIPESPEIPEPYITEPEQRTKYNPNPNPNGDERGQSGSDSEKTDTDHSGGNGNGNGQMPAFAADAFVSVVAGKLGISQMGRGGKRQHSADLACLRKVAAHIAAGHLGETNTAIERAVAAADAIGKDARDPRTGKIDRPAAVFQKRINDALEKRDHAWGDGEEDRSGTAGA